MDNNVLAKRLGKVFSKENLAELEKALDVMELPIIPQDITIGEAQALLTYHGNALAFLYGNSKIVEGRVRNTKALYDTTYNQIFKKVHDTNRNLKTTEVKSIVQNSPAVIEVQKEFLDAQYEMSKVEAGIEALKEQNINLRKIVSMMQSSIETDIQ